MTRLKADLTLVVVGIIWGLGFVSQKSALAHIGPFTFIAAEFLLSTFVVLPFALREKGFARLRAAFGGACRPQQVVALCSVFAAGVLLQQYGLNSTNVVHTSFLTGLYVVMVPLVARVLYKTKISLIISLGGVMSVVGVWLLSGGDGSLSSASFGRGDLLVIICAFFFAMQVAMMGHVAKATEAPFTISFLQYLTVCTAALILALGFETIEAKTLMAASGQIVYSGLMSGGLAFTLQAVAQQHTPSSDSAIILSSESLVGGLGGVWILGDKISTSGIIGCAVILAAIMLVEIGPLLQWHRQRRSAS